MIALGYEDVTVTPILFILSMLSNLFYKPLYALYVVSSLLGTKKAPYGALYYVLSSYLNRFLASSNSQAMCCLCMTAKLRSSN